MRGHRPRMRRDRTGMMHGYVVAETGGKGWLGSIDRTEIGTRSGRISFWLAAERPVIWTLAAIVVLPLLLLVSDTFLSPVHAQDTTPPLIETVVPEAPEKPSDVPAQVDVEPEAPDERIAERLTSILLATDWFQAPRATVREGVVFLEGRTDQQQY